MYLKIDIDVARAAMCWKEYEMQDSDYFYNILMEGCKGWMNFPSDEVAEYMEDEFEINHVDTVDNFLYFSRFEDDDQEENDMYLKSAYEILKDSANLVVDKKELEDGLSLVEDYDVS